MEGDDCDLAVSSVTLPTLAGVGKVELAMRMADGVMIDIV